MKGSQETFHQPNWVLPFYEDANRWIAILIPWASISALTWNRNANQENQNSISAYWFQVSNFSYIDAKGSE